MKYNEVFNIYFIVVILILTLFIIYKSRINIIFSIDIDNSNFLIKLNIKYLFNMLNLKIQIYPPKKVKEKKEVFKNKKQKENLEKSKPKLFTKDLLDIYNLVRKIKVKELYSRINFANKNVQFTSFIYVFINMIYGNLSNIIDAEKMYLNVVPNFTEDYIKGNIKIHISPKIKDLYKLAMKFIKIYRKNKDGGKNESNRFNTKSYGNNS